ncbi:Proton glutamate symport protein [Pseudobythopirellula maris]|uniref:Proton glutamate symport protein n=1 Tax=Pseudobythopirellula maris TaxID=2527991 RepID=A0A5C5ZKX7_9BACT|nr:dicarboxylate/amino acid:cation symporter [Pseudobythopirellula maris]TWT88084.1 Proton glutamate symport protein [Pseudobythopirellula maris]
MKLALHWKILLGMAAGLLFGALCVWLGWQGFVTDWVKPFGTIFINALKLIAVPLIVASLVKGVSDLKDLSRLSSMGGRTIVLYLMTTAVAVTVGLTVASLVGPGRGLDAETRDQLVASASDVAESKMKIAAQQKEQGPLQPLVDLVPDNLFAAAADNGSMLKVIVFTLFFGVGLILVPEEEGRPVKAFFDGLNEVILKLIDLIMLAAPLGVFALMAALVAETPSFDVFFALLIYSLCVVAGLAVMTFIFYPALVVTLTGRGYLWFFRGLSPAQLLAFSTSSSAATLPVTMERVEEHLGVDEEVASFVLPIGATVNMDGTSLYQAVAAVFIAQAFGMELTLANLFTIGMTAMLASVGTAAVPSAGIVMLIVVLEAIEVPSAAIALIIPVDRVLDMLRTVANITSDATVAMLVAKSTGKLGEPHVKEWDDDYHPQAEESPADG